MPGALRGRVMVGDQPAAGANVQLQNFATGFMANAMVQNDGSFYFASLAAGTYLLSTAAAGKQVQMQVSVDGPMSDVTVYIPGATGTSNLAGRAAKGQVSVRQLDIPKKARSAFQDAEKALQRGDIKRAFDKLQQALKVLPNFAEALALRARLDQRSGNVAQAQADAEAAVRADPNYAVGFFVLAATLNGESHYPEAQRAAVRGEQLAPDAWQGHFELGQALAGQNQFEPAIRELNLAANAAPPGFLTVYLVRAFALGKLQRFGDAQKDLQEVLRRSPSSPEANIAREMSQRMAASVAH